MLTVSGWENVYCLTFSNRNVPFRESRLYARRLYVIRPRLAGGSLFQPFFYLGKILRELQILKSEFGDNWINIFLTFGATDFCQVSFC